MLRQFDELTTGKLSMNGERQMSLCGRYEFLRFVLFDYQDKTVAAGGALDGDDGSSGSDK